MKKIILEPNLSFKKKCFSNLKAFLIFLFSYSYINVSISQPSISSFSPATALVGASVTIAGSNFNSTPTNNVVYFGAVKATVVSGSATSLTVKVPGGATYAPVSVLNTATHLSGYSSKLFSPSFTAGAGQNITSASFKNAISITPNGTNTWKPKAVVSSDVDGDGKADMVMISRSEVNGSSSSTVSVLKNLSNGGNLTTSSFSTPVDFALTAGYGAFDLQMADIDGDGKLDIVVANLYTNYITIFKNTATTGVINTASFAAGINVSTGDGSASVAIADFDKDGKPDIVATNSNAGSQNSVSVIRNTSSVGSISFNTFQLFSTGAGIRDVAIGDLNADNKPDIITANKDDHNISILINTSSAGSITSSSFASAINVATASALFGPFSVAIADFDNDGKEDVAVADGGGIFKNIFTSGTFSNTSLSAEKIFSFPGVYLQVADINGDHKPDIISDGNYNDINICQNNSKTGIIDSSSFTPATDFVIGTSPYQPCLCDLNGDGRAEIAAGNEGNSGLYTSLGILQNNIGLVNTGTPAGKIQTSSSFLKLHVQDTANLTAKLYNTDGTAAAVQPAFTWISSNTTIATAASGQIIAKALGTTYVAVADTLYDTAIVRVDVVQDSIAIASGPAGIVFSPYIISTRTNSRITIPGYTVTDWKGKVLTFQPTFKFDSIAAATVNVDTIHSLNKIGLYYLNAYNSNRKLNGSLPVFIYNANTTTIQPDTFYQASLQSAPVGFNKYNIDALPIKFTVNRFISPAHAAGTFYIPTLTTYVDVADSAIPAKPQIVSANANGILTSKFPGSTKVKAWFKNNWSEFTSFVAFDFSGSWEGKDQNNKDYKICFQNISPDVIYDDGLNYPYASGKGTGNVTFEAFPDVDHHWTDLYYIDTTWQLSFPPQIARIYTQLRQSAPSTAWEVFLDASWFNDIDHFKATDGTYIGGVTPPYPSFGTINFARSSGCGQDSLEKVLTGDSVRSWIYASDSLFDYTPGEIEGYTTLNRNNHTYFDFEEDTSGGFAAIENGSWSVVDNNKLMSQWKDTTLIHGGSWYNGIYYPTDTYLYYQSHDTYFISQYNDSIIKIDSSYWRSDQINGTDHLYDSSLTPSFIYVYNPDRILPLKFIDFTSVLHGENMVLNWKTGNEKNVRHYNIQRSTDGIRFINIGQVKALNTIEANYQFNDLEVTNLDTRKLYYRLAEQDLDGKLNYSQIRIVTLDKSLVLTVAPNPVRNTLRISLNQNLNNVNLSIIDITGKIRYSLKHFLLFVGQININVSSLSRGLYILNIKADQLIKQIKIFKE